MDFVINNYSNIDGQVSWHGIGIIDGESFEGFMLSNVSSRLHDREGSNSFEAHLRGLATTGFASESLDALLTAVIPEERDWAIGEAIAEAYLGNKFNILWPWNTERDKKTSKASLPGADIVGFQLSDGGVSLALGEVKTSCDTDTPPNVMNGRSGMIHQLDKLASDLSLIHTLLKWLWFRCKGNENEELFDVAITDLLFSDNKAISLFGVLIRDTQPNELDLKARGKALATKITAPTTCVLTAVYLPCPIATLPSRVQRGGGL